MSKLTSFLSRYKYLIALVCVFNFLLTPIPITATGWSPAYVVVVNYTLLILGSSVIAFNAKSRFITYLLGLLAMGFIWAELTRPESNSLKLLRLFSSLALFGNFCLLLLYQLKRIKKINLQFILGPILGFVYLGILGGILFEITHVFDPSSFQLMDNFSGYTFYYFSFISITTVGYGDITPLTPAAQSLTLVLNIIGQFYLAIVIGVFVGKYINVNR